MIRVARAAQAAVFWVVAASGAAAAPLQDSPLPPGNYTGAMVCRQGPVSTALQVNASGEGVFSFSGGGLGEGSFKVAVRAAGRNVITSPVEWINQPRGGALFGIRVQGNGARYEGGTSMNGCSQIALNFVGAAQAAAPQRDPFQPGQASPPRSGPQRPGQFPPPPSAALPQPGQGAAGDAELAAAAGINARYFREVQVTAAESLNPAIFAPDRVRDFAKYIEARSTIDELRRRGCEDRVIKEAMRSPNNPWGSGGTVERRRQALAPCAGALSGETLQAFEAWLTQWAAGQPANAKGLEALNSAVVEYAGQWSSGRIGYAGDIGQRVVAVARRTLLGRRDAIFNQNRAGLIAELNDPASQLSTESLFNADRGFMARLEPFLVNRSRLGAMPARPDKSAPFYRSAVESWKSPRQAAGESMAGKEPTSEEIAYAILNSFRTGGARQMSPFAASMPYFDGRFGVQLMDALAPITFQIYDLRKRTCRREGAGFRCAYQVYAYTKLPNSWASHPFGGLMHEAFNGAYGATGEALLIPAGGGYRMPELDEAIIKAQMGQAEQMTKVLGAVADAAGSAFNVMNDAANPPRQPGAKSQMEQEQDDRIEEDKRRGRR